jgi:Fe-S oxidoreductase
MATYKSEFLAHHYQGRLRPASHYSMGWLPLWAALAAAAPEAVNALAQAPGVSRLVKRLGGIDRRRGIPSFAPETFQAWFARRAPAGDARHGEVLLWPDTFTNHFHPAIGQAAVEVLEAAGWRVTVPAGPVCCGLTWISTGQLGVARWVLRRTLDTLRPYLDAGVPVVGLEPSCTAVLRNDARDLFPDDPDVQRLGDQTRTLAELLHDRTPDWQPPARPGRAIVQTHCHQHAILGTDADAAVLARIGVDAQFLDSGCCGLAGNFGFEQGHYDVSVACAERVLLPAVRDAPEETVVLADGFSCRTQIDQGDAHGRRAMHLAELLRAGLHHAPPTPLPERHWARRPEPPSRRARLAALAAVAGGLAGFGGLVAYAARRATRWG